MAKAFTSKAIEAAKPDPDKRIELPDPALSGLYLVIQPSGAKSWALRYRFGGKPAKLTLGRWPLMSLADARAAASEAVEKTERGKNPSIEKKAAKTLKLEVQLSQRDKIKTLVDQFEKRHLASLKSGALVKRELDRFVVSQWGDRDIHDITKRDVIDLLDGIADSGRVVTANRIRSYLSKFLNWAVERDILASSPALGVKPVAKETSRDRVLSDDEIRWLWAACEAEGFPWGALGRMLLLTGQRLGEIVQITDAEIVGSVWHLTAARTKNGRAHDVPLSDAACAVLANVGRVKGTKGYVFTTTGETPLSGFHKGRAHLAVAMQAFAEKERGQPVEIPHWTFHDLRRTAATGMARLGIAVRVTEAVLNHASGTASGIVAVYQRHDYAAEKKVALDAWAAFVIGNTQLEEER
jgi:integrase